MTGRGICEVPGKATLTKREYCTTYEDYLITWNIETADEEYYDSQES